jgi:hypothetical protein
MRINRSLIRPRSNRSCEVLATIRLPKGKRIAIDKALDSLLDALAVEGSVEHIDAVFIRVVRGAGAGAVEVSIIHLGTTQDRQKAYTRARGDR